MKLRGVVFGWYHQRNAGDDRFAHCIESWLDDHELIFLPHTYPPPLEILEHCDYVILGGGSIANQINGVFSNMRQWINRSKIPVFGVSLTVSSYEAFQKELKAIPDTGGMIWVRDETSEQWLNFDDGVVFAPDIAWLFPRTFSHETRTSKIGVNFRPWSRIDWNPKLWQNKLTDFFGDQLEPWPLCFGKDPDLDVLRTIVKSDRYPTEFDPTLPSRSQLIVAMRYHAIIFSIQAGTPFIAVNNTRKVKDLLQQVNLEEMSLPLDDPSNLDVIFQKITTHLNEAKLQEIAWKMSEKTRIVACLMKEKIEEAATAHRLQKSGFNFKLQRRINKIKALF